MPVLVTTQVGKIELGEIPPEVAAVKASLPAAASAAALEN